MATITVGTENSADIDIYYEDHGSGPPVVLVHGYPLSGRAWDKQVAMLLDQGYRAITYDRRGFGKSSQPASGYDYDTFADDLNTLLEALDLDDVTLVGHSMGTGEVTRYIARFGSRRVARGVLVSPIPPFLRQTPDNPEGLPSSLFDGFIQAARQDTPAWLKGFLDSFYNVDKLRGTLLSDQAYQASWNLAVTASATAAAACIPTWLTDFRPDLPKIDVPILVIHGDDDNVLPYDKTAARLPGLIRDLRTVVISGGPHAIAWTHADQVNAALLRFLRDDARSDVRPDRDGNVAVAAR
jgi:non-heme chloroperoxidase